jgi:hypothetical protein
MATFAKITAIVLILFGIIVMGFGLFAAGRGALQAGAPAPLGDSLISPFVTAGFQVGLGAAIFLWGLILAAVGQGLYLIARVAESSAYTYRLLQRRAEL